MRIDLNKFIVKGGFRLRFKSMAEAARFGIAARDWQTTTINSLQTSLRKTNIPFIRHDVLILSIDEENLTDDSKRVIYKRLDYEYRKFAKEWGIKTNKAYVFNYTRGKSIE